MTAAAVQALVDAAKPLPRKINGHPHPVEAALGAVPQEWVEVARDWRPLNDLQVRKVVIQWAVETLIQAGKVGALVAAGGTGKTTLLLKLAICIATGRAFFGMPVKQGTFVLLSNDDPQEDLEGALALVAQAMDLTRDEYALVGNHVRVISLQGRLGQRTFTAVEGGAVLSTGLELQLLEAVEGIPDLVGVALDTLRQFSGGSSNDEQVIKITIASATEVANRTGAFVILPHHTGKQNYREGITDMYAGSGSAAIADNCRFVLLLQTTTWADIEEKVKRTGREEGAPLVLTSTRGSLLVRAPEPIFLHRQGFSLQRVAGALLTKDQIADKRDREVLQAVRDGAKTKTGVQERLKGKRATIFALVDVLTSRGLLSLEEDDCGSRRGSQKLMVTTAGARVLDDHD